MSRVFHSFDWFKGPRYISYSRMVSQPNSSQISSGAIAFLRLLPIFPRARTTGVSPWYHVV